jgi:alpha-tubulin suppressor-like RCC1 family protein
MDSVVSASIGQSHTMAIKTDGSLWAWGSNEHGLIGNGEVTQPIGAIFSWRDQPPVQVMESVTHVSTGGHTLALKTNGSLWAWGRNYAGQFGSGTTKDSCSPVKILDGMNQPELALDSQ